MFYSLEQRWRTSGNINEQPPRTQPNFRNQLYGRVQLFFVCVTRCFCCGLDTNFLTLFLHERFLGPLLLVSNCVFYGGILIGGLVVWLDGYARFDLCACLFVLLSLKVVALCVMAIGLLDVVFLTLLGFVGFFIGSGRLITRISSTDWITSRTVAYLRLISPDAQSS